MSEPSTYAAKRTAEFEADTTVTGEVRAAMRSLEHAVAEVEKLYDVLRTRLVPVLRPASDRAPGLRPQPPETSPLADEIHDKIRTLGQLADGFGDLLERLDL
jgi:hypothetical protein